ncbi:metallophosphoesterase [Sphingobium sp. Sx8-8]|uniref:metallophosphoesterase n=1 Tax=Sphingobium sp. Sx8-8 TaxID=2933617 RepID=UPI001F587B86
MAANSRVYAVGDIHGRCDLLDEMLEKIANDSHAYSGECEVIFLGDYINRGPASAQALDRLSSLASTSSRYRFLMGNHEEIFLRVLNREHDMLKLFIHMGGRPTILSYGINASTYRTANYEDLETIIINHVPHEHIEFIGRLESQVIRGDYLFVHAGVDVSKDIEAQDPRVTRWIRKGFTHSEQQCEKTVVYGHTVYCDVHQRIGRIGIDTGAYASGKLTAIALEGSRRWLLQTGLR